MASMRATSAMLKSAMGMIVFCPECNISFNKDTVKSCPTCYGKRKSLSAKRAPHKRKQRLDWDRRDTPGQKAWRYCQE